jgi:hypothetical protein
MEKMEAQEYKYKGYIAGPMSGYKGYNFESFYIAQRLLKDIKPLEEVYNPAELGVVPGFVWADYLRLCLHALLDSRAIIMLNNWEESSGAVLEHFVAVCLGKPVYYMDLERRCLRCDESPLNDKGMFLDITPHIPVKDKAAVAINQFDKTVMTLIGLAIKTIRFIIGTNAERHGGHVEWLSRMPKYHLQKVIGHAVTCESQLDGHKPRMDSNRETAVDHAERVVVRGLMALHTLKQIEGQK